MARDVQKDITTTGLNNSRVLYHVYHFFLTFLPTSTLAGKYTIIDNDPGGGDWLTEAGPGDGAWFVVQCETAFEDAPATKWQVLIGTRETGGAIAGLGAFLTGFFVVLSQNGGFDTVADDFGANPIVIEQATKGIAGTKYNNVHMHLFGHDRGFEMALDQNTDGVWDSGYIVQEPGCPDSEAKPCVIFGGNPDPKDGSNNYGIAAGTNGSCSKADESGYNNCKPYADLDIDANGLSKKDSRIIEHPILLTDTTFNRNAGMLREVRRIDYTLIAGLVYEIPDGAGGTLKRICLGKGLSYIWD